MNAYADDMADFLAFAMPNDLVDDSLTARRFWVVSDETNAAARQLVDSIVDKDLKDKDAWDSFCGRLVDMVFAILTGDVDPLSSDVSLPIGFLIARCVEKDGHWKEARLVAPYISHLQWCCRAVMFQRICQELAAQDRRMLTEEGRRPTNDERQR